MRRAPILLVFVFGLFACSSADCINEVREEVLSPNGKFKVVVFGRNCGATTGFSTQASVLRKEENLPDGAGNIFIIDKDSASVSWKEDGGILVVFGRDARVFKSESFVDGICIEYRNQK